MRYARQILFSEIGEKGQEILAKAKVLIVGLGGLGSPVATYLAEAGVGHLELLDVDTVSISNLNRQFLYSEKDIDCYKAHSAERAISHINSEISVHGQAKKITDETVFSCIEGYNLVVDCVDSLETRKIVHNACLKLNIPLVEAGIDGFYGFVAPIKKGFACLNCMGIFEGKQKTEIPVLGAVAGVVGSIQALEAIKIILNIPEVHYGKILYYDGKKQELEWVDIPEKNDCAFHKEL